MLACKFSMYSLTVKISLFKAVVLLKKDNLQKFTVAYDYNMEPLLF